MNKTIKRVLIPILTVVIAAVAWFAKDSNKPVYSDSVMNVPPFSGESYVVINNNEPEFTQKDFSDRAYEYYSPLDALGRCGYAIACIGEELMPTEEREGISSIKPSGWMQAQYDEVEGKNLYNRCHLIGFQLTGENANELNLITGTRYLNVDGMLPFENMVADYIQETGNHVLYRVTPIYDGDDLVARGVQMEALSVEDEGVGICFNIYAYNNQPGIIIDYATGESRQENTNTVASGITYILNTSSKKFHMPDCEQGENIKNSNRQIHTGPRDALIAQGYTASKCCDP